MLLFIVRRLLASIPVLLLVSVIVFALADVLPGDAATAIAGTANTSGNIAAIREDLGLDKPVIARYFIWLGDALQGNLGRSYVQGTSVADAIKDRLPITIEVGLAALLVGLCIGIPLGALAALSRGSLLDTILTIIGVVGFSVPGFLVGLTLLYVFSIKLRLGFPVGGWTRPQDDLAQHLQTLALPSLTVGVALGASVMRLTRSAVLEVLSEDFVRTARAKGLSTRIVVVRHVLRSALIPVVTIVGLQSGVLVSGLVITEQVFSIPGVGRLLLDGAIGRDVPQIMASTMLIAIGVTVINMLVDIMYTYLDPRVRVF